jgi:hypothetical protein
MTKKEIENRIKSYNKTMVTLRIAEKRNENEHNFDRKNVVAEQICNAKECETETIKNTLYKYLKTRGVIAYGHKLLNECNTSDLIHIFYTIK